MIKKTVQDAINSQITKEIYSAHLYLSMSVYFKSLNLNGFANWMRVQYQEEMFHAMKFFDYILERGGKVELGTIMAPPTDWNSILDVFEATYNHEQAVTASINNLADISLSEHDHATSIFMQWFITEQVEEEANTSELVERIRMVGDDKGGLFLIDNELKTRVFTPPIAGK